MHLRKALNVCNPMYVLLLCHGLAVANDRHCAERGSDRLLLETGVRRGSQVPLFVTALSVPQETRYYQMHG